MSVRLARAIATTLGYLVLGACSAPGAGDETGAGGSSGARHDLAASGAVTVTVSAAARAAVQRVGATTIPLRGDSRRAAVPDPQSILRPSSASAFERRGSWIVPAIPDEAVGGATHRADVRFSASADAAFRVEDRDTKLAVDVSPVGLASRDPEIVDGFVVYAAARGDGDVVHRVTAVGTEDFVRFARRPAKEELAYAIALGEGVAGLRLVENALELLDAHGAPRLRMAPPCVVDAAGAMHAARVELDGCAYDEDPRPPWGRAPTPSGSAACTVRVAWPEVAYPAVVDPAWGTTGWMTTPRAEHTASVLASTKVLVAGGSLNSTITGTVELYDPATGTWSATASFPPRTQHTATVLANGKVLVAGGRDDNGSIMTSQLYDPSAGTWSSGPKMFNPRSQHTAALLLNGKVLIAGGTASNAAEIYDPATNAWSPIPNMKGFHNVGCRSSVLASGKVLVTGGGSGGTNAVDLYDPATNSWTLGPVMSVARSYHTSTRLSDGRVFIVGDGKTTEFYDPATNAWSPGPSLFRSRQSHAAALLPKGNGKLLVAGGYSSAAESELYDPDTVSWTTSTGGPDKFDLTLSPLPDGKLLAAGGSSNLSSTNQAWLFLLFNGLPCASAADCASTFCADGFCCDTVCSGACDVCSFALGAVQNGKCGPAPSGYAGKPACASPYFCDGAGTACPSTCISDAGCVATHYCAANSTCQPRKAKGASCNPGTDCKVPGTCQECASAACVDGFCCDTACANNCDVCSKALGASADGTCTNLPLGSPGFPTCPSPYFCNGASAFCPTSCTSDVYCPNTHYCAADSTCKPKKLQGAVCNSSPGADCLNGGCAVCATGNCSDGVCCDKACAGSCDVCAQTLGAPANGTCATAPATYGGSPSCGSYLCTGAAVTCPATCTTDAQCAASAYCRADKTCQPDQANGAACTSASQCTSGFCADGVCCDGACNSACKACSAAAKGQGLDGVCDNAKNGGDPHADCADQGAASCGFDGTCNGAGACRYYTQGTSCGASQCAGTFAKGQICNGLGACGPDPVGVDCSPYVCAAGSCKASCAGDQDCVAGRFCKAGSCIQKLANGGACAAGSNCQSAFCVDGVCCDTACNGTCQACTKALKGSGTDGVCGNAAVGQDPHADCPDNGAGSCQFDGTCNGVGACRLYASGTTCGVGSCSGNVAKAKICNGLGSCGLDPNGTDCTPYACVGGACKGTCATNADCAPGDFCKGTACVAKLAQGAACSAAAECVSNHCADGVCCDSDCNGTCQACTKALKGAGADGTCGNAGAGADPHGDCPDAGQASCGYDGACNGAGLCRYYAAGTSCGATQCTGNLVKGQICNGLGACGLDPNGVDCAPYACAGGTCKSGCAGDGDCVTGNWCSQGACVPKLGGGAVCSAGTQCATGHCVDGVCCDVACSGTCQACSKALKGAGADGVCGHAAIGTDPRSDCADFGAATCGQNGLCDGNGACQKYASGTSCGATQCAGNLVKGQICNGLGSCSLDPNGVDCKPFVCATGACKAACAGDADCTSGNFCDEGDCVPKRANGSECGAGGQCTSGHCADGVCCDTACSGLCQACTKALKVSGADGVCGNALAGSDAHDDCPDGGAATCGFDGACDGSGACRYYASGTSCGPTKCTGNVVKGQICNGLGACGNDPNGVDCEPYVCTDGACKASCGADADCVAGDFCAAGKCVPKLANGAACSGAGECVSGHCTDGVCCDTACNGLCQACTKVLKAAGTDGVCGNTASGADPHDDCADKGPASCGLDGQCDGSGACRLYAQGTSCGATQCAANLVKGQICNGLGACGFDANGVACAPFACVAGACKAACDADADCSSGNYCSDQACVAKHGDGDACAGGSQCTSGYCVDGVCCNQKCDGTCQACSKALKGAGSDGTCGNALLGSDPHDDCADKGAASCNLDGTCNGSGACRFYVKGTSCGKSQCTGNVAKGEICDGLGNCTLDENGADCGHYVCSAGTCKGSCASDDDCIATDFCNAGTCTTKRDLGAACAGGSECKSTYCVDGVCCNTLCNGLCQACTKAAKAFGSDGTCGNAANGKDPHDECPDGGAGSCELDGACDGSGTCRLYAPGTTCGPGVCAGDATKAQVCDGLGTCAPAMDAVSCGAYGCAAGACNATCAGDGDCANDAFCLQSSCVPKLERGDACSGASECASGFCADGVCCNRACDAQCEACDGEKPGTCGPIEGAPHEGRPACSGDGACAGTCDGVNAAACSYPASKACGSVCAGDQVTASLCDGLGACVQQAPKACTPYVCGDGTCLTTCATGADCATGFACASDHTCSPSGATCVDDHTLKDADGKTSDCGHYKCSGDRCRTECTSIDDCVAPFVCRASTKECVPASASSGGAEEDGGCSIGRARSGSAAWIALAVALLARSRRRLSADARRR